MPKLKNIEILKAAIRDHLTDYLQEMGIEIREDGHLRCPDSKKHQNDDESFSACIYPDPNHYRCFVCDDGIKDIFYVAHILEGKPLEGAGFIQDNILYFAKKYQIPYETKETTKAEYRQEQVHNVLNIVCDITKKVLQSKKEGLELVLEYIADREWDSLSDTFDFGYCDYSKLIKILRKHNFSDEVLEDAGLIPKQGKKRGVSELLFDKRLIFPVKNHYGQIVGFIGRKIAESSLGDKYLNFRETILYTKGNVLFNLDKARKYPHLYIVEGQGDVFTMYRHGIRNVVALCGTGFSKQQYNLLVSQGIRRIILLLDGDKAGKEATLRIVDKELKDKKDLEVYIKELPADSKDPDEFLRTHSRDAFDRIPELQLFDWKLAQLKEDAQNEFIKNDLMRLIVIEEDFTAKDKLIKKLAEVLDVPRESVSKEIDRHEKYKGNYLITSADVIAEQNSLEHELEEWDSLAWSRTGDLLGLKINNFDILTKAISGMQPRFYLIAADTNVGKTCMLLNFANGLLESNQDIFILLFSIDDTLEQIIPRFIALRSDIAINTVANPKFKIERNKLLSELDIKTRLQQRETTMNYFKSLTDRFAIKEQAQVKNIEQMEKLIRIYRQIAGSKQLVVMVDNIHRIKVSKKLGSIREQFMHISSTLKAWKENYKIPVIVTAELKKIGEERKPRGDDIKETKDLQYDADFTALIYTDYYRESGNVKLFFSDSTDGYTKPVLQFQIIKNKTSAFKGSLYFKFYPEFSKIVECSLDEIGETKKE